MDPRARYQWWIEVGWNSSAIDDAIENVVRAWSAVRPTSRQHQRYTHSDILIHQNEDMDDEDELGRYVSDKRSKDNKEFNELLFWKAASVHIRI